MRFALHDIAFRLEPVRGIEPPQPAWKAGVLPLNYTDISEADQNCPPRPGLSRVSIERGIPYVMTGWSQLPDLNRRPPDPKSGALPSALNRGIALPRFPTWTLPAKRSTPFWGTDTYGLGLYYKERARLPQVGWWDRPDLNRRGPQRGGRSAWTVPYPAGGTTSGGAVFPAANCKWRFGLSADGGRDRSRTCFLPGVLGVCFRKHLPPM